MAAQGFLNVVSGRIVQVLATLIGGSGTYANQIPALDAGGKLDISMMPTSVLGETVTVVASEALVAGNFVNIYNNAGTANVRKADASSGNSKEAHGFVLASVASSGSATVFLDGINSAATAPAGLTAAGTCWLGAAGVATGTAPTASASIVQELGVWVSGSGIQFNQQPTVTLA